MRFAFVCLLLASPWAVGAINCGELGKELKEMERAQGEILSTMIENHEMFASSLEQYARIAGSAESQGKKNNLPQVFQQMKLTAAVFRKRGAEGRKLQSEMDSATQDLFKRIRLCLRILSKDR